MPQPNTIASAASVSPIHVMTFITGTVAIATIVPPANGAHMLIFIFTTTTPTAFTTTGNVKTAVAPTQNVPVALFFNPVDGKYYPGRMGITTNT